MLVNIHLRFIIPYADDKWRKNKKFALAFRETKKLYPNKIRKNLFGKISDLHPLIKKCLDIERCLSIRPFFEIMHEFKKSIKLEREKNPLIRWYITTDKRGKKLTSYRCHSKFDLSHVDFVRTSHLANVIFVALK